MYGLMRCDSIADSESDKQLGGYPVIHTFSIEVNDKPISAEWQDTYTARARYYHPTNTDVNFDEMGLGGTPEEAATRALKDALAKVYARR